MIFLILIFTAVNHIIKDQVILAAGRFYQSSNMLELSKNILHFSCINSVSAGVWNYVKMSLFLSHAVATAAAAPWAVVSA